MQPWLLRGRPKYMHLNCCAPSLLSDAVANYDGHANIPGYWSPDLTDKDRADKLAPKKDEHTSEGEKTAPGWPRGKRKRRRRRKGRSER